MDKYISFNQFTFQYDAQAEATIKNISFDIAKGEKVLILGPSGSGKSTLAQCLNGIIPNINKGQAQGQVTIGGQDIFNQSIYDRSQLVSTVLQDPDGQFIGLTVAEDLAFSLENDCVNQGEMKDKVALWAERLNLSSLLGHRPQDLSGGQKQRLSIARAVVKDPDVYIFDDSFSALDYKTDAILRKRLKEVTGDATVLIVAQRVGTIMDADQIIVLDQGEIVGRGTHEELMASNEIYREIANSKLNSSPSLTEG